MQCLGKAVQYQATGMVIEMLDLPLFLKKSYLNMGQHPGGIPIDCSEIKIMSQKTVNELIKGILAVQKKYSYPWILINLDETLQEQITFAAKHLSSNTPLWLHKKNGAKVFLSHKPTKNLLNIFKQLEQPKLIDELKLYSPFSEKPILLQKYLSECAKKGMLLKEYVKIDGVNANYTTFQRPYLA